MERKTFKLNLGSFDFAKGLGMITVILVHTVSYYNTENSYVLQGLFFYLKLVAAGIIPMFLIISGYGFKESSLSKMLKKTFHSFLVPYLWVMVGYTILYPIVMMALYKSWSNAVYETIRFVLAFLLGLPQEGFVVLGYPLRSCAAAWYFLTSFGAFNLLNIILKTKNNVLQLLAVFLCFLCGFFLLQQNFYYYCLPHSLICVCLCYTGYILKKYRLLDYLLNSVWLYFILILITLAEGIWGGFSIYTGGASQNWLDYAAAACVGLLFVMVGLKLGQYEGKITNLIKSIGVYTYWILAVHSVEMIGIPWSLLARSLPEHQLLAYFIEHLLRIIIISSCCYILKKIAQYKYRRSIQRYAK